ncbi:MAG: YqgE/AlgH family protein [Bacteroidetes bacterium]|nr:YqgE/AlgH family protein [Bacteroidota bacterium]
MAIYPASGNILLAEPGLQDFYFRQSVILLGEMDNEGAFGMIINKRTNIHFSDVVTDHVGFNPYIYLGGPVKSQNLFFIHRMATIPGSKEISKGIYWGGDSDVLFKMLENELIDDSQVRFFLGYAGWTPKQLDAEIEQNSWQVTTLTTDQIFNADQKHLWADEMLSINPNYKLWFNMPEDILQN